MKRLFLLLFSIVGWMTSGPALAQGPANQAPAEFVWEDDSLQAFVKAVEQQKPMVVLFGSPPEFRSEKGTNYTNDIRKEFNKKELIELRDRAVFTLGFPDQDEYARRMGFHLKLTEFPTISIIQPRTDKLTESYRMEGFFKADEIAADLKKALPARPKDEKEPVAAPPKPQNENPPAEKLPLTDADKKAIQESVSAYAAAFKAGDLDLVAKLTAQPMGFMYEQGFALVREVGQAKRGLLLAMDERFGKQDDVISFGTDDEKIRQQMKKLKSFFVLDYDTALGKIVTIQVEATMNDGRTEPWKLIANRPAQPDGKWMVWPKGAAGVSEIGFSESWQKSMKKLAAGYEALAGAIKAGKYPSREKAHLAVFEAYSQAVSPVFSAAPPQK